MKENNKVEAVNNTKEPLPPANPKNPTTLQPAQGGNTLIPGTNPTNLKMEHREHRDRY